MFENYKVVVVCPAGRRHVADIMRRHIERARPLVDGLQWWLNTDNGDDLEYMRGLERAAPDFYRAVYLPGARFNRRHRTINRFFIQAIDPDTIYIRIDDDVVWMDEHCIEQLVRHRLKFPEAYLVYGNIVNSSRFMHLHQKAGAFDPGFPISYEINHATNRHSVPAALAAHTAFLKTVEALAAGGDRKTLLAPWISFDRHEFGPGVHNDVNMICWFGRDFAVWGGICPPQIYEESWICFTMPAKHGGRVHEACGAALCSHYASVIQWNKLMRRPDILERYERLAPPSQIIRWPEPAPPVSSASSADAVS